MKIAAAIGLLVRNSLFVQRGHYAIARAAVKTKFGRQPIREQSYSFARRANQ